VKKFRTVGDLEILGNMNEGEYGGGACKVMKEKNEVCVLSFYF